ncbi:hypothetical protein [Ferrimonas balearica]|uniref:hypothetical protein n=1 Tax=Ferrimonas balearica TaxID=44012 RepID=UPI001C997C75|nr:hypothetical protein [Ferrimonas balearica]MBY5920296.1 hypothetical protein [Ferrimonas balearica]MBY5997019.1 hypothetical protein [Ferrimonas balearica]
MKAGKTERFRHSLNALALAGALFIQQANAAELLNYCLNQIDAVGAPAGTPLNRHRQFGQLVLLQDQLKYLAQTGNSDDLGRCTLALQSAMGQYRPQSPPNPEQLSLETQLIHLDKHPLKSITIRSERCWLGVESTPSQTLDLESGSVSRYLNQAEDPLCRERVWVAYQNRANPDADRPLRRYRENAERLAWQASFPSDAHWQLRHTPLTSPVQVEQFLNGLTPDGDRLPWQPAPGSAPLSQEPTQLAQESLGYLIQQFGLSLLPIDERQWQVWDGARLLGYLELSAGESNRQTTLQSHWVGLSPAVVQMVYREKPWYPRHWHQWLAQTAETLVSMAGRPLPYQMQPSSGAGYGFGRALARSEGVQRQLLGASLPPRPLFDATDLYQAQMALAVATQNPWSPTALQRTSDALFERYFARPAPKGLTPWPGHSDWAIAGARAYLPLWYANQGQTLLEQRLSGTLSPEQLWQQLTFLSESENEKGPAEFAEPFERHPRSDQAADNSAI